MFTNINGKDIVTNTFKGVLVQNNTSDSNQNPLESRNVFNTVCEAVNRVRDKLDVRKLNGEVQIDEELLNVLTGVRERWNVLKINNNLNDSLYVKELRDFSARVGEEFDVTETKNLSSDVESNLSDGSLHSERSEDYQTKRKQALEYYNNTYYGIDNLMHKEVEGDIHSDSELDDNFFKASDMDLFADFMEEVEVEQEKLEALYQKERHSGSDSRSKTYVEDINSDTDDDLLLDEFDNVDENSQAGMELYEDFFGPKEKPKKGKQKNKKNTSDSTELQNSDIDRLKKRDKVVRFDEPVEPSTNEKDETSMDKSLFEMQQIQLQAQIRNLESEAIAKKNWYLQGESEGKSRPQNSLIETEPEETSQKLPLQVDVNYVTRAAPVISNDLTNYFEELIKKRIANIDYDDVIRKLPKSDRIDTQLKKYGRELKLEMVQSDDLSKKANTGLGDIYAKEYETKVMGHKLAEDEKLEDEKKSIKVLFDNVIYKLNALSSYYFTPKPNKVLKEGMKKSNLKNEIYSIAMEENIPIAVSKTNSRTPNELLQMATTDNDTNSEGVLKLKSPVGVVVTNEEITQQQRKAHRRELKKMKRKREVQRQNERKIIRKFNPGLGKKYAKKHMAKLMSGRQDLGKNDNDFTNSSKFFKMMQESVSSDISRRKTDVRDNKKQKREILKYKL